MSLEFYTNRELLDELFARESFKGIVLSASGEKNNIQDGNGGCTIRIAKGMAVIDILTYLKAVLRIVKGKFPAAYEKFFGENGI